MQHKSDVAVGFLHQWMATFFQRFFLMLQKLSFYVADNVF
jgi:hypothetical protein